MRLQSALLLTCLIVTLAACRGEDAESERAGDGHIEIEGRVLEVARSAGATLIEDANGRMWSVTTSGRYHLAAGEGGPSGQLEVLPGLIVRVVGEHVTGDRVRPDSIIILDAPPLVLVAPRSGATLTNPVVPLEGFTERGRTVRYKLTADDEVLTEGTVSSEVVGARRYGPFRGAVTLPTYDIEGRIALSVWQDGTPEEEALSVDIVFAEERTLNLYFSSLAADPERLRCDAVYPVTSRAPVLLPALRVVEMLMDEPPVTDRRREYFSDLAAFGSVNEVSIDGARARVDLREPAAGTPLDSCSVVAAKEQLRRTLTETFGVTEVEVLVDGTPLVAGRGH